MKIIPWKKKNVVGDVSMESIESLVYGMVSAVVAERNASKEQETKQLVELILTTRSEVLTLIKELERRIDVRTKTELIGKDVRINPEAVARVAAMTSEELREHVRSCAKKIARIYGKQYPLAYELIYDRAEKVIGFHPYKLGKESKGKGGKSYLNTVDNRGKLCELVVVAQEMAQK